MASAPGYLTEKQAVLTGLRRIEGQVRGLRRLMLTEASEAIARHVRS